VAIAGVGSTTFTKASERSVLDLATDAALTAIADAGLRPEDVDGLVSYFWSARDTVFPAELVRALGMTECHYQAFDALGGSWACSAVITAAMAIHAGLCETVLVYRAANGASERFVYPQQTSGRDQWSLPFGVAHAAAVFGPHVMAHMDRFGTASTDLAQVAVAQREHARLNTKAMMREPLTVEQHQASPWIVRPFRLFDCCINSDGAVAVVVTSAERARRLACRPVLIAGMEGGSMTGIGETYGAGHAWELSATGASARLYARAGITPEDIDLAELYDPFTGMCLLHMEGFGIAPRGGAGAFVREGGNRLDGVTPVNTHGGLLSEAYTAGLGHVVEAVQQLRPGGVPDDLCHGEHTYDRSSCRQVRDADVALVCSESGDSSLLLRSVR
jgi:acetyl-CoA acetyltransferase